MQTQLYQVFEKTRYKLHYKKLVSSNVCYIRSQVSITDFLGIKFSLILFEKCGAVLSESDITLIRQIAVDQNSRAASTNAE